MAHTKSAVKRARQNVRRRGVNRSVKGELKTVEKKLRSLTAANTAPEELKKQFASVSSNLDKAAKRGIIHPNKAARKKSRLARLLNKAKKTTAA